jgi:uncharacterized protein YjbI with pentapeptide repeats
MTLHGEQPEGAEWWSFDRELHAKNRRDWNKWAARALGVERRAELLGMRDGSGAPRFSEDELTPHTEDEFAALATAFENASGARGAAAELPTPGDVCDFEKVAFNRAFIARGLLFLDVVNLSGATFSSDAFLRGATFSDDADLSGATFSGAADFSGATFSGYAKLVSATFSGYAGLTGVTFSGDTDLAGAKFSRTHHAVFSRATFKGWTVFLNAELEGETSFANAAFEQHPPSFHGAKLNEGVAFHGVRWPDPPTVPAPPKQPLKDDEQKRVQREIARAKEAAQQHVYNYQRLKQLMEGLKKHEDELNFFAMEMAAQGVVDGGWRSLRGALSGLYGAVSDYGRSILRPSILLLATVFLCFVFVAGSDECQGVASAVSCAPIRGGKALALSLTSALGFLPLKKEIFGDLSGLSPMAHIWMGIETVLSFALLFLIGLALRNRFRMK